MKDSSHDFYQQTIEYFSCLLSFSLAFSLLFARIFCESSLFVFVLKWRMLRYYENGHISFNELSIVCVIELHVLNQLRQFVRFDKKQMIHSIYVSIKQDKSSSIQCILAFCYPGKLLIFKCREVVKSGSGQVEKSIQSIYELCDTPKLRLRSSRIFRRIRRELQCWLQSNSVMQVHDE